MTELPKHLGGHGNITHIDEGALTYLISKFHIEVVLDIGCGVGGMIPLFKKHNLMALGIDGDYTVKRKYDIAEHVIIHDFTKGEPDIKIVVDLAWSIEFLEHISEEFLPNVFEAFKMAKYVFCTANPGRNKYHFNPQPVSYWIKNFESNGFQFLEKETKEVKVASTMNRNFVRDTGMIFKNLNL